MPLSKQTKLAQARRQLKRLEQDEPAFRLRIANMSQDIQEWMLSHFTRTLQEARNRVLELEQSQ